MKQGQRDMSILVINEKGQLCTVDIKEKELKEYVFNKIGDCSNGIGICLGFNSGYIDKKLGW
ncbi:MAG: hypothetical protein K2X86_17740 [Cytophagaceae bacterium]|nr:hypothetical protein [Cytophagaceae bacterium]